jgi:hypothetical protein
VTQLLIGVFTIAVIAGAGSLAPHAVENAVAGAERAPSASASPEARVQEYCRLAGEGGHLTEEGWHQIASYFVTPGTRPDFHSLSSSTVAVTAPCVVDYVKVSDDGRTATVSISSRAFGVLDLALGRYTPVPVAIEGRDVFRLTKTAESNWKIDSRVPGPTLSVKTAIRELEALRSRTFDREVKRNATQGLKVLRTLRPEKH